MAGQSDKYDFPTFAMAIERKDYGAALRLASLHAESGDSNAQCAMGFLYQFGLGVVPDMKEAELWLRRAAEQDNSVAWNNLGTLYVSVGDKEKALICYERAKELGFDCANPYPPPL